VFAELRRRALNVQETENVIFDGAEAAVARINLDGAPSDQVCARVKKNQHVLDLQVVKL
jgi:D-3-phosphoglycerate dehydrogenase